MDKSFDVILFAHLNIQRDAFAGFGLPPDFVTAGLVYLYSGLGLVLGAVHHVVVQMDVVRCLNKITGTVEKNYGIVRMALRNGVCRDIVRENLGRTAAEHSQS